MPHPRVVLDLLEEGGALLAIGTFHVYRLGSICFQGPTVVSGVVC